VTKAHFFFGLRIWGPELLTSHGFAPFTAGRLSMPTAPAGPPLVGPLPERDCSVGVRRGKGPKRIEFSIKTRLNRGGVSLAVLVVRCPLPSLGGARP